MAGAAAGDASQSALASSPVLLSVALSYSLTSEVPETDDRYAPPLSDSCRMPDDSAAYVAITRLQAAYADVVTRRAWSELESLFLPDAPIHIDTVTRPATELRGAHALGEFISAALTRFDFFEFVILNTVVDIIDERSARGRVYIEEIRHEAETDAWSHAFGLYQDSYTRPDGRWQFAARRYRSLARKHPSGGEVLSAPD
jgi:SnoaL-like protein